VDARSVSAAGWLKDGCGNSNLLCASARQLHAESRPRGARTETERVRNSDSFGNSYQEAGRDAWPVDHGTNVTFVIYPKADSSLIVERQGREPNMGLKTGFDRLIKHHQILKRIIPPGAASPRIVLRATAAKDSRRAAEKSDHRGKGGACTPPIRVTHCNQALTGTNGH